MTARRRAVGTTAAWPSSCKLAAHLEYSQAISTRAVSPLLACSQTWNQPRRMPLSKKIGGNSQRVALRKSKHPRTQSGRTAQQQTICTHNEAPELPPAKLVPLPSQSIIAAIPRLKSITCSLASHQRRHGCGDGPQHLAAGVLNAGGTLLHGGMTIRSLAPMHHSSHQARQQSAAVGYLSARYGPGPFHHVQFIHLRRHTYS
jgi:hypothetical protein